MTTVDMFEGISSLAQSGYCRDQGFDHQDLTEHVVTIDSQSEEGYNAREALFNRHPDRIFVSDPVTFWV